MLSLKNVALSFPTFYNKKFSVVEWLCDRFHTNKVQRSPASNVLEEITLDIVEGETLGIIGKNGSGKSTLLRLMAGIYEPDEGFISREKEITSLLSLGTGFDNHLTGLENVYLNGLLIGLKRAEIEQKLTEIIEFADIGEHINKPMKYYSNGMISRLSFSIMLAINSDVLLIDEIFSVGDLTFQKKSAKAMKEKLNKTSTKIIVSHDLSLIQELCDRVVLINNKTIVYDGKVMEGINCYKDAIGKENE